MPQSSSPPRGTPFSHKRGNDDRLRRYNCFTRNGGNAILQHVGPEAKGSSPITGLTLLWDRNSIRGNFNHWQVPGKEAGQFLEFSVNIRRRSTLAGGLHYSISSQSCLILHDLCNWHNVVKSVQRPHTKQNCSWNVLYTRVPTAVFWSSRNPFSSSSLAYVEHKSDKTWDT